MNDKPANGISRAIKATKLREDVGSRVLLAREALGVRQGEFAKRIGIRPPALWNIESGRAYPSFLVLVRLFEEFGFTSDWLLRGVKGGLPADLADAITRKELEQSGS